jgi:glycosyltransferase involved in cell wall biosynthesis
LLYLLARARSGDVRLVVGSGDMPYCIWSVLLSRLSGVNSTCDIYDNFETYSSARIPFMLPLYHRALRKADVVITFEATLAEHLRRTHRISATCSVPNGVDPELFHPRDKLECRSTLGIPPDIPVIGYVGSLTRQRGVQTLFDAFSRIASASPDALFLMAGGIEAGIELPALNIRHLGLLPQRQVPQAICASDVCTIHYADNAFARCSFPQKMMEYIACRVPFVTPDTGGAPGFLAQHRGYLYRTGDAVSLADAVLALLQREENNFPPVWTWVQAAERFLECLPADAVPEAQ